MTFAPLLTELRDALTAAINIDSQNEFLLGELLRAKDANARLLTALTETGREMQQFRRQLADQDLELRRLRVAVAAAKARPEPKRRRVRPRISKRTEKALS